MIKISDEKFEQVNDFNKRMMKEFLEQNQLSDKTLKQYKSAIKIFLVWILENADNMKVIDLKFRHGLRYQNYLIAEGLSSNGIRFKRNAVSSFCGYIEVYYGEDYPNFKNIYNKNVQNVPKVAKKEKLPLTKDELEKLIKHLEDSKDYQQLAYLMFSYSSGCRREEARQMLKEIVTYDYFVDKHGNSKNFYQTHNVRAKGKGKTGKVRKFTFDELAMKYLKKWMEVRGEDDCPYLFVSSTGKEVKQVSENTFNYWCKAKFEPIVGRNVHPHLLRSTKATHSFEEGKDISKIQKLLGHQSSETTQIYIVRDEDEDIADIYS